MTEKENNGLLSQTGQRKGRVCVCVCVCSVNCKCHYWDSYIF